MFNEIFNSISDRGNLAVCLDERYRNDLIDNFPNQSGRIDTLEFYDFEKAQQAARAAGLEFFQNHDGRSGLWVRLA